MKLLFENWRTHLNEISFEDAKKRLETKALTKWIKGMAFDEETKTMTLAPHQIEEAKNNLARLVLVFVPEDLYDGKPDGDGNPTKPEKGLTLEWLISVGINDPLMKKKFYNEAISGIAPNDPQLTLASADARVIRGDFERYWRANQYSDQKDIFTIKSFADLAVAADRAKSRYDDAMRDKEFEDPEQGTEVFEVPPPYKDKWFIAALHTKAAACHYGKKTDWCTATDTDMFDQYYEPDDPLFFFQRIMDAPDSSNYYPFEKGSRFQFHFGSDQFMDEEDDQVEESFRDELIVLLGMTGAAKTLPEFVPGPLAAPVKKYQILQYFVTKSEVAEIIYDENTTPEELMAIAKKYAGAGEGEIIEMIVESDNVTKEVLEYIVLSDDDHGDNALSNPKLTDEFINKLAYSENTHLRYLASYAYDFGNGLRNEAVSGEALDKLSEDPEIVIRMRIAQHPFALPETLTKMANRLMKGKEEDRIEAMLSNLLRNDNLPSNLFAPLLKWSKTQTNRGDSPKDFRDSLAPTAVSAAALNPNTPAEVLREIGDTMIDSIYPKESNVSYALASNPNTPGDILLKLTKSKIPYIRNKAFDQLEDTMRGVKLESLRESFKKFMK